VRLILDAGASLTIKNNEG
jgi:hypothetical protein